MSKKSAFDQIPFPMGLLDRGGAVLSCNQTFLKKTLCRAEDAETSNIDDLLEPVTGDNKMSAIAAACVDRMESVLVQARPVHGANTQMSLLLTPDVSEPRCFIQIVTGYLSEIDQSQLSSVSSSAGGQARQRIDFLSGISHQLRTPVNGVLGIADLLAETSLNEQQASYVDILSRSCNALVNLVNEIQSLAHLEQGVLAPDTHEMDVRETFKEAMDLFTVTANQKKITSRLQVDDAVPDYLLADKQKLHQILAILLGNAYQYTDQGRVTVSVSVDDGEERPVLTLSVADTGIGIAQERLPALFKIAESETASNRSYSNTGLGLILCHKLVELLGGSIDVESKIANGTTFLVKLPVSQVAEKTKEAAQGKSVRASSEQPTNWGGKRWSVLLAEDNPVNQTLFKKVLERYGHAVTVVGNGQEAVAKVQLGTPFDVILMDVSMPVMDGLDATAMIRSLYGTVGNTPILALTAHAMDGDREKFINAGMDGYQSKPVDPMTLQKAIAEVIESRNERLSDADELKRGDPKVPTQSERLESGLESLRRSRE